MSIEGLVQLQQTQASSYQTDVDSSMNPSLSERSTSTDQSTMLDTLCASLSEEDLVQLAQIQETSQETDGLLANLGFQAMTDSMNCPTNPKSPPSVTKSQEFRDIPLSITSSKPTLLADPTFTQEGTKLLPQTFRQSREDSTSYSSFASLTDVLDCSPLNPMTCMPRLNIVIQPPNVRSRDFAGRGI